MPPSPLSKRTPEEVEFFNKLITTHGHHTTDEWEVITGLYNEKFPDRPRTTSALRCYHSRVKSAARKKNGKPPKVTSRKGCASNLKECSIRKKNRLKKIREYRKKIEEMRQELDQLEDEDCQDTTDVMLSIAQYLAK